MKTTVLILALFVAVVALADSHFFCYDIHYPNYQIIIARIPGPGVHGSLEVVHSIPLHDLPNSICSITYDGEYWWVGTYGNEIVCFDRNGDLVNSFAAFGYGDEVTGLGWDGEYVWYTKSDAIYQIDTNGNPGPYDPIYSWEQLGSLVVIDDLVLVGEDVQQWDATVCVRAYTFDGHHQFSRLHVYSDLFASIPALAYHDGIIWASVIWYEYDGHSFLKFSELRGYEYGTGSWYRNATVEDECPGSLSVCRADFLNIAEESLGKIKAYFAEE